MTNSPYEERLAKLKHLPQRYATPKETFYAAPRKSWVAQERWDMPKTFVIKVAPVGAFIMKEDNPNQVYTTKEIREQILASLEAGACAFHTHP